ncbi:hypothetical protein ACL02S_10305 [Nocardia sp. 004]|uniref:hypothetical protein n=1 Tax=Nocardia sp. 004 TaxID=3385978 RepID=UPI0039A2795F
MELTERQRHTLGLICDTFLPEQGEQPRATDLGTVDVVAELLGRNPRATERRAFLRLLDIWDSRAFALSIG